MEISALQIARAAYQPKLPKALQGPVKAVEGEATQSVGNQDEIKALFPNTYGMPVIIVEGIMTLLNKKLRDIMDIRIFVDCDSDERLIRNIQRDTVERGRDVQTVLDRYLSVLKPMHEQFIEPTKRFAHIIIPEGGDNVKGIDMVCKYIESIVK